VRSVRARRGPAAARQPEDRQAKEALTPQEQAIDLLKKKYATVGRQKDVARLYHRELELLREDRIRSKKLRELVSLYLDTLEDAPAAFETLASLVLLDPAVNAHRVELAELADHINAHERLSSVLVEASERAADQRSRPSCFWMRRRSAS